MKPRKLRNINFPTEVSYDGEDKIIVSSLSRKVPIGYCSVYIGGKSILSNPYPILSSGGRDDACDKYEVYFADKMKTDLKFRAYVMNLLNRVKAGDKLNLQCFCAPLRCHGDTVKYFIESQLA